MTDPSPQDTMMPVFAPLCIQVWELTSDFGRHCPTPVDSLSPGEITRANRFRLIRDRNRFLSGRAMLRSLIAGHSGLPPHSLAFDQTSFGKPYMSSTGSLAPVSFSLSYSNDSVVCAFVRDADIGIDIENPARDVDYSSIAARFFSSEESRWYNDQLNGSTSEEEAFLAVWTLKEAYVKAIGRGLSLPTESYTLIPTADGGHLVVPEEDVDRQEWSFFRTRTKAGIPAAIACRHAIGNRPSLTWHVFDPTSGGASVAANSAAR